MTRARRGLLAASLAAAFLAASALPAMAGDMTSSHGSVVGDWRTSTAGVKQTVTFDKAGKVFGSAGCNRFTGGYTVKGGTIKIGPLATTMMYCDGKMDAEREFLTKLEAASSFHATATTLKLSSSKGTLNLKAA